MKNTQFNPFCARAIVAFAASVTFATGGTITWDSTNATSSSWALDSNWVGGHAPAADDDVVITGGGAFNPTDNSAYTGIAIRSLTLTGSTSVALSSALQVGAGGVFNTMTVNSLNLKAVNLTTDQTWGGTRTIFVQGAITGAKMNFEGSAARFDTNSPAWAGGIDVRTLVNMGGSFAPAATFTPWGTGTLTLINQKTDLTNSNPVLNMSAAAGNDSLANANTLANNIALQDPGTGNFTISQSNDSATLAGGHFFNLSGVISGTVNPARTLTFSNSKGVGTPATFTLTNANTYNALTKIGINTTLALGHVNALQSSTLDTGTSGSQNLTFTLAGDNTYNIGSLAGADDIDVGGNTISVGGNHSSTTYSAVIAGSGGLAKAGSGIQTLTGTNTFNGTVTVNEGALAISGAGTLGSSVGGTVVNSGAALRLSGGAWIDSEALQLNGTGIADGGALRNVSGDNYYNGPITFGSASRINSDSGTLTLSGNLPNLENVTFGGAGNVLISGNLSGTAPLNKDGNGRLTLSGSNSHSGGTIFTGSLGVESLAALGSGSVTGNGGISLVSLVFNTPSDISASNAIGLNSTYHTYGITNANGGSTVTLTGAVTMTGGTYNVLVGTGVNNAGFVLGAGSSINTEARLCIKDTSLTIAAGATVGATFGNRITLAENSPGSSGGAIYLENGVVLSKKIADSNNSAMAAPADMTIGMKSPGIASFAGDGTVAVDLTANASATVSNNWKFHAVAGATVSITDTIRNSATGVQATISKTGAGTVAFTDINTYTGATAVEEGTLALAAGTQASPITVQDGASLEFTVGSPITSSSTVTLVAGSTVKINGTPTLASYTLISAMSIDGTPELASPIPGYDITSDGTSITLVKTGAGSYSTWASANGIPGQPASGDADFDGLSNLMEYGLGTNPIASSQPSGSLTGGTVSFTKGADARANGDVNFSIQESDDLGMTDPWADVVTQNAPNASTTISYTLPTGKTEVFTRLKVTQIP